MVMYGHEKKTNPPLDHNPAAMSRAKKRFSYACKQGQGMREWWGADHKKEKATDPPLAYRTALRYNIPMNNNGMNLKWTFGNSKLVKTSGESLKIVGYGISADTDMNGVNSCPGASACRGVCYAKQGTYLFKNVREARLFNLQASFQANFRDMLISDLTEISRKYNCVRIHDSGDFHTQSYLDAWKLAADRFASCTFYAYTKSLHLDLHSNLPANFKLVQSLGGKYDDRVNLSMPHSRIFSDHDARIAAGYVDGNVDDLPAINGEVKIGLVYHGVKKLTDAQSKFFS